MFKKITQPLSYKFTVSQKGLYSISVTASCKSGKLLGHWGGQDLRVEIDDQRLREAPAKNKPQYKDIPSAWNGTKIKGLSKTVIFVLCLESGEHIIKFIPYRGAIIEKKPEITLIDEKKEIELLTNLQAEDDNCRPWITIALIDLPLNILDISVKCEKRFFDSDDVKIIIDGQIQKNKQASWWAKWAKNWYWQGRFLKGQAKETKFYPQLAKGIHYIEFWADRMPVLHKISLELGEIKPPESKLLKAKIVWQKTNLREETNISSKILADLKRDEIVEILKKAIQGEAPFRDKEDYTNAWHKVKFNNKEGYIFSKALEIKGEDAEKIKKLIFQKAKELKEDGCLMLAIAKRESKLFPYAASEADAQGIFQLKDKAVIDVNVEFKKNFKNRFDLDQNIEAGILYFQLVKKKYQGKDNFWQRCLAAWNRGWGKVPVDPLFKLEEQPFGVQQFIHDVFEFWENCKSKLKNKGKISILNIFWILILGLVIYFLNFLILPKFSNKAFLPKEFKDYIVLASQNINLDKDKKEEKLIALINKPSSTFSTSKIILIKNSQSLELSGDDGKFLWWKIEDFNKNGKIELAVMYDNYGSAGFKSFYLYEWQDQDFKTLLSEEKISGKIEFKDLNKDEVSEILHKFSLDKWCCPWIEIYKWDKEKEKYFKANNLFPEIYQKWLKDHQSRSFEKYGVGIPPSEYFETPEWKERERISNCLREKAILNSQGIFADGNDCYD